IPNAAHYGPTALADTTSTRIGDLRLPDLSGRHQVNFACRLNKPCAGVFRPGSYVCSLNVHVKSCAERSQLEVRPWQGSVGQAFAMAGDFAGGGEPQRVLMRHDVAQRAAKSAQAKWLTDDE